MQDKMKLLHLRLRRISKKGLVELGKQNLFRADRMKETFVINAYLESLIYWILKLVSMYPIDRLSISMHTFKVQHELKLIVDSLISLPS